MAVKQDCIDEIVLYHVDWEKDSIVQDQIIFSRQSVK